MKGFLLLIASILLFSLPVLAAESVYPLFLEYDSQKGESALYLAIENSGPKKKERLVVVQLDDGEMTRNWAKVARMLPKGGSYYKIKLPNDIFGGGRQLVITASLYDAQQAELFHISPRYLIHVGSGDPRTKSEDSLYGMGDTTYHDWIATQLQNVIPSDMDLNPSQNLEPQEGEALYFKELTESKPYKGFRLASTTPANLGEQVSRNPAIFMRFTEEIDPASVGEKGLELYRKLPDGTEKTIEGKVSVKGFEIHFQANENLWPNSQYRARLLPGVKSKNQEDYPIAYEWTFTTQAGEQTAPPLLVMAHFPEQDQMGVGVRRPISINFNEPLNPNWQDFQTLQVLALAVPGEPALDGTIPTQDIVVEGQVQVLSHSLVFHPKEPLLYGTKFQVTLKKGLPGKEGHVLRRDLSFTFQTMPMPEMADQPLKITSIVPEDRAARVPLDAPIVVTFDQALMRQSISEESLVVMQGGARVAGKLEVEENQLIFTPERLWKNGETYRVTLAETILAQRGNPLLDGGRWYFTTKPFLNLPTALDSGIRISSPTHAKEAYGAGKQGIFRLEVKSENPLVQLVVNGATHEVAGKHDFQLDLPFQIEGKTLEVEFAVASDKGRMEEKFILHAAAKPINEAKFLMALRTGAFVSDNYNASPTLPGTSDATAYFSLEPQWRFGKVWLEGRLYLDQNSRNQDAGLHMANVSGRIGWEQEDAEGNLDRYSIAVQGLANDEEDPSLAQVRGMYSQSLRWEMHTLIEENLYRKIQWDLAKEDFHYQESSVSTLLQTQRYGVNVILGNRIGNFLVRADGGGWVRKGFDSQLMDAQLASASLYLSYTLGNFVPSFRHHLFYSQNAQPDPVLTIRPMRVRNQSQLNLTWLDSQSGSWTLFGRRLHQGGNLTSEVFEARWLGLQFTKLY